MEFDVALADIEAARGRIAGRVRATPTWRSEALSRRLDAEVFLKLECLQLGGSFKMRGVLNKLATMDEAARARGIVTVSGGNHAIATAEAARATGTRALVTMPAVTPAYNVERTRGAGAEVELCECAASAFARAQDLGRAGMTFVHPYDDPAVIAGHGTLGLELAEAVPGMTDVFVSIGGGGFMSGVAAAVKGRLPAVRVHGVETRGAETMTRALAAGKPETIAPSSIARTLGAPFATERTMAAARRFLEGIEVVPDAEAVAELDALVADEHVWCEPAASCTVAAALRRRAGLGARPCIVLVLCGSNVAFDDVARWRREAGPGAAG
ncbi:MAG: threonine/serine dehydratase [Alphaproteobacteria bacterium]